VTGAYLATRIAVKEGVIFVCEALYQFYNRRLRIEHSLTKRHVVFIFATRHYPPVDAKAPIQRTKSFLVTFFQKSNFLYPTASIPTLYGR
jgi:hypothetical protein